MLKCIAVDDEVLALDLLEDNIKQVPFLHLVKKCRNAYEVISVLQTEKIDLIFLDIRMPGLTGIQLLQSLSYRPMAIFITAFDEYAMEGYNLDVVDYLLKPVALPRFLRACNKAFEQFHAKSSPSLAASDHFFVQADYSLIKVSIHEVIYIQGDRDYVKIHYTNGTHLMVRISMKGIEQKLPPKQFVRIHKSYIISVAQISSIRKNAVFLNKDIELPLSEPYRDLLLSCVNFTI